MEESAIWGKNCTATGILHEAHPCDYLYNRKVRAVSRMFVDMRWCVICSSNNYFFSSNSKSNSNTTRDMLCKWRAS